MLVPLGVLALGAVFAGMAFFHLFHRRRRARILARVAVRGQGRGRRTADVGRAGAADRHHHRLPDRLLLLHPASRPAARSSRRGGACSTCSSTTNGISTSCMTSCSCARPSGIGRFLWKKGDGMVIDGLGPDGIAARVLDAARGAVRLQIRLCLSLCPGDAAGRGGAGHLVHGDGRCAMSLAAAFAWSPSCRCWARRPSWLLPTRRCGALDRAGHHHRHVRAVAGGVGAFRPRQSRLPAGREAELAGRRHLLSHGRGRHFHAVRGADRRPDALLHRRQLGKRSRPASPNT